VCSDSCARRPTSGPRGGIGESEGRSNYMTIGIGVLATSEEARKEKRGADTVNHLEFLRLETVDYVVGDLAIGWEKLQKRKCLLAFYVSPCRMSGVIPCFPY
jgi:hypothetical protein